MLLSMKPRVLKIIKVLLPPFLVAIYPALFLYGNNVTILILPSLLRTILFYTTIGALIIVIFYFFLNGRIDKSANAALIFLIFFNIYGIVFDFLLQQDLFLVTHYTLFPLFLLVTIYTSYIIAKVNSTTLWNGSLLILSILVVFNLVKIIPAEIKKSNASTAVQVEAENKNSLPNQDYPDIYYIVFDEFSGFEPMRNYWQNQKVDDFVRFLDAKGFFIAENSHSSSIDTVHQMATRLNYQEYVLDRVFLQKWFDEIANNRAMSYLKSQGYTTVVFDETQWPYPSKPPIVADYYFKYSQNSSSDLGFLFDEYGVMVANNTMLRAFSNLYRLDNPELIQHKNMIFYTISKVANLNEVPSPKFVYVHLMFPHFPFMFDENGNTVDPKFHHNWNYYLGNYNFSMQMAEEMIINLLSQANLEGPPVIIFQSDHGARNHKSADPYSEILDNFPEEYKTNIMFTMYMSGYDFSNVSQDIDPINTFPIVFNYLFDANIPLK